MLLMEIDAIEDNNAYRSEEAVTKGRKVEGVGLEFLALKEEINDLIFTGTSSSHR